MKSKKTAMALVLTAVIAVSAFAQQYDSEDDFSVEREGSGIKITKYLSFNDAVRIPPRIQNLPVTSIGELAFAENTSFTSVTIPNSVISIGNGAFSLCESLESITIPDSVKSIGSWAFSGCENLASITIGNGVTSIGSGAFRGCTSLASITMPKSVASIENQAFRGCTGLTSITFQGTISSGKFSSDAAFLQPFPGDLRAKFYAKNKSNGTPGTYTRPVNGSTWTKQ